MWISEALVAIETAVLDVGTSGWLLLIVLVLCCVDGFFPPVPSESIVIAAAALAATQDGAASFLVPLVLVAACGALAGDLIAHTIGSRVPLERLAMFRTRRGARVLAYTRAALLTRGSTVILTGRFVPVARVAVNMTAGSVRYPRRRFTGVAAAASLLWAAFSALMGVGTGYVLQDSPLLAMVAGVAVGVLVGLAIDRLIRRRQVRISSPHIPAAVPGAAPGAEHRPRPGFPS